jgi:aspartate aminotransferase
MAVGAAGALNTVLKTILNPGDEVIVIKPYFMEYFFYAANFQGVLAEVDSNSDFSLNTGAIKAALNEKTAAVIINSPNNPTGRLYSAEAVAALAAILTEHGEKTGRFPYLIADEVYRDIVFDGKKTPPVLGVYRNSIVVSSYSKKLSLAGERIGYVAVGPDCDEIDDLIAGLAHCTRVLGFVNAPALMQRVIARLTDASVDVNIYKERRDIFKKIFDEVGIEYAEPEGAFYIFAKVPAKGKATQDGGGDDMAFSDHLKKYLILGTPGTGFHQKGWMRFAYCVSDTTIKASASAFKKAVADWKG